VPQLYLQPKNGGWHVNTCQGGWHVAISANEVHVVDGIS